MPAAITPAWFAKPSPIDRGLTAGVAVSAVRVEIPVWFCNKSDEDTEPELPEGFGVDKRRSIKDFD